MMLPCDTALQGRARFSHATVAPGATARENWWRWVEAMHPSSLVCVPCAYTPGLLCCAGQAELLHNQRHSSTATAAAGCYKFDEIQWKWIQSPAGSRSAVPEAGGRFGTARLYLRRLASCRHECRSQLLTHTAASAPQARNISSDCRAGARRRHHARPGGPCRNSWQATTGRQQELQHSANAAGGMEGRPHQP